MKSPGQKAYEANRLNGWRADRCKWSHMLPADQQEWERIAAAVTAPEPKSLGQIAYDAALDGGCTCLDGTDSPSWNCLRHSQCRDAWENVAQAVIAAAKERGELP